MRSRILIVNLLTYLFPPIPYLLASFRIFTIHFYYPYVSKPRLAAFTEPWSRAECFLKALVGAVALAGRNRSLRLERLVLPRVRERAAAESWREHGESAEIRSLREVCWNSFGVPERHLTGTSRSSATRNETAATIAVITVIRFSYGKQVVVQPRNSARRISQKCLNWTWLKVGLSLDLKNCKQ